MSDTLSATLGKNFKQIVDLLYSNSEGFINYFSLGPNKPNLGIMEIDPNELTTFDARFIMDVAKAFRIIDSNEKSENSNNLDDPHIESFYNDIILKDRNFYGRFFDLIEKESGNGFSFDAPGINDKNAKELKQSYYLHVKLDDRKPNDSGFIGNEVQTGGVHVYDMPFVTLLPDKLPNNIQFIMIPDGLITRPTGFTLQDIFFDYYNNIPLKFNFVNENPGGPTLPSGTGGPTLPSGTGGPTLPSGTGGPLAPGGPGAPPAPPTGYTPAFQALLAAIGTGEELPAFSDAWKKSELSLSEHLLKSQSKWVRDGYKYNKTDDDQHDEDNCVFIKNFDKNPTKCLKFFEECLKSTDATFEKDCGALLTYQFDFTTNPGINSVIEKIEKIDPMIAFMILKKFKFGSHLDTEPTDPLPNFQRYKVQSVASWLEELWNEVERCIHPSAPAMGVCDPRPLKDQLGPTISKKLIVMAKDPNQHGFFTYLDILVNWVNANPQVLNPEEVLKPVGVSYPYPPEDKSLFMYQWKNPYKPAEFRLRGLYCGLERLKGSIINDLAGYNGSTMLSNIVNMPVGIQMPFSRTGFSNAVPMYNTVPLVGGAGGLYETERELANINSANGYVFFKQIYDEINGIMEQLKNQTKLTIGSKSATDISAKLDKYKQTEEEIRKMLLNLVKRYQLYQASRGYVDSFRQNDKDFETILNKHSNLLGLTSAYNRRSNNLIDILQTVISTVLRKLDEGQGMNYAQYGQPYSYPQYGIPYYYSQYERPLTMGYQHRNSFQKRF